MTKETVKDRQELVVGFARRETSSRSVGSVAWITASLARSPRLIISMIDDAPPPMRRGVGRVRATPRSKRPTGWSSGAFLCPSCRRRFRLRHRVDGALRFLIDWHLDYVLLEAFAFRCSRYLRFSRLPPKLSSSRDRHGRRRGPLQTHFSELFVELRLVKAFEPEPWSNVSGPLSEVAERGMDCHSQD